MARDAGEHDSPRHRLRLEKEMEQLGTYPQHPRRPGAAAISRLGSRERSAARAAHLVGELVFQRDLPPGASVSECLRIAWEEARSEARATYEAWRSEGGLAAYLVFRAAQDRADAAQDALAQCCTRRGRESVHPLLPHAA
jgi:hypothetical protein